MPCWYACKRVKAGNNRVFTADPPRKRSYWTWTTLFVANCTAQSEPQVLKLNGLQLLKLEAHLHRSPFRFVHFKTCSCLSTRIIYMCAVFHYLENFIKVLRVGFCFFVRCIKCSDFSFIYLAKRSNYVVILQNMKELLWLNSLFFIICIKHIFFSWRLKWGFME